MGDFSANVGGERAGEKFGGTVEQNEPEDRLVTMAETKHLYIDNSRFKEKTNKKCASIAPNTVTESEIDVALFNNRRNILGSSIGII
ncbi:unnamed protein product [Soboliphyme baturini]|uniref:Uncharacterized protein n=1 Tax=Soboliphyme baturini TaxID=241478 RepID=A0A183ISD2_9BILA|nr:unnamed protein product [Soboliphyme baturini]